MIKKRIARERRAYKVRKKIREDKCVRLSIHRTPQHIYAQVIATDGGKVIASASSLDKVVREASNDAKGKVAIASVVGKVVAERAIAQGVKKVAFDRSGFKYHGRVKALADAAREGGMEF